MFSERATWAIYLRVLGPLVLAVLTLVVVSAGGFHALSGARAYVGGESLWSKARGQAVVRLRARLAGQAASCAPTAEWLAVPLGDRQARLALEQDPPDRAAAREGFLRGGNPADDIDGMIDLYVHFGALPLLSEPIAMWREGDRLIDQLAALGERICATAAAGGMVAPEQARADLQALDRLDAQLIAVEMRFSASLGHASHQTERLLTGAILSLALLLVAGGIWFVMRSLRAQVMQRSQLLEANTRWDLAAAAAGVGVFVWRPDDDVLQLDRRARLLYELDADATTPVPRGEVHARMHPDDRVGARQRTDGAAQDGLPLHTRFRMVRADGSVRHLEAIGTLRNVGQDPDRRQMFGVLRDVTDEEAAAQLRIERDAAERSAKARSEFLSRLSHELRTPLNAVLGLAQVLDLDTSGPLTAQQRRHIRLILDSGWHLLRLVNDVLDITAVEAGHLVVDCVPTDAREVLRASLGVVEPERSRAEVAVVDEWPAGAVPVLADRKRLQQVFAHLLSNACKYNRRGGRLLLSHRDAGDQVCLSVTDEGAGIAPAQLADLFQPFTRLPGSAGLPGAGLGLVVAKLLVEQMHGRIEIASEPGRGSTFTVCLRTA